MKESDDYLGIDDYYRIEGDKLAPVNVRTEKRTPQDEMYGRLRW